MIWSGLLAGLLIFQAMRREPPLPLAPPPVAEIAAPRSEPLAEAEWRLKDGDTFVHDGRRPYQLETLEQDEDRYGRKLRVVTRGGRSLGDQLVAEGRARTWSGRRAPWY